MWNFFLFLLPPLPIHNRYGFSNENWKKVAFDDEFHWGKQTNIETKNNEIEWINAKNNNHYRRKVDNQNNDDEKEN